MFIAKKALIMRKQWVGLALLSLAGCSGSPPLETPSSDLSVMRQAQMPTPTGVDLLTPDRPYLIGPFDKLKIEVFGVEELQREIQTDASGNFLFPLVGQINGGGRSPSELAIEIEDKLRGTFVRNPSVTVNLEESLSQLITVDGEVKRPGSYPVIGRMTLIKAIASAQGVDEYASLKDVVVFRTVNGQRYAGLYNLDAIRKGTYEDPELFANDVVVVGDSPSRRMFKDLLQASPLLTTPLIILAQQ